MKPVLSWSCEIGSDNSPMWRTPVVLGEVCIVATYCGQISCLSMNNGDVIWQTQLPGWPMTATAWNDSHVIFCIEKRGVVCVSVADGEICWANSSADSNGSEPLIVDSDLFYGSDDHCLHCLNLETGSNSYKIPTEGAVNSGCASYEDLIIFGSDDRNAYCFSRNDHLVKWNQQDKQGDWWVRSDPVVLVSDNWCHDSVFVGLGYNMACINIETGGIRWSHPSQTEINQNPLIHGEDILFVNDSNSKAYRLFCLNVYGGYLKWFKDFHTALRGPLAYQEDSFLLPYENSVRALSYLDGTEQWRIDGLSLLR